MTAVSDEHLMQPVPAGPKRRGGNVAARRFLDRLTIGSAYFGGALVLVLLAIMAVVLLRGAWPAMHQFGWRFFGSTEWDPKHNVYGAFGAIVGTIVTSAFALIIAVPISIGAAVFLVRIAPRARGLGWTISVPLLAFIIGGGVWLGGMSLILAGKTHRAAGFTNWLIPLWAFSCLAVTYFLWKYIRSARNFAEGVAFVIELLASIPSIVYGLWGIAVVVPVMQETIVKWLHNSVGTWHWMVIGVDEFTDDKLYFPANLVDGGGSGQGILTASVVLAIMIVPIITAITRDVLRVVPKDLEQGAYGLGATWWQATKLVLNFAKGGIFGAIALGLARAIGETMAVAMLLPQSNEFSWSFLGSANTMTTLLANKYREAPNGIQTQALTYIAVILLVITLIINFAARVMVYRVMNKVSKRK